MIKTWLDASIIESLQLINTEASPPFTKPFCIIKVSKLRKILITTALSKLF